MKTTVLGSVVALLVCVASPAAADSSKPNYECTSKKGTKAGFGRPTKDGETSNFVHKTAKEGEYIVFQYKEGGKEYWFRAEKCKKLDDIAPTTPPPTP